MRHRTPVTVLLTLCLLVGASACSSDDDDTTTTTTDRPAEESPSAEGDAGSTTSTAEAPVLLLQGEADDTVPAVATELLTTSLCEAGEAATMELYPGFGHDEVLDPSLPDMVAWIATRLAGDPPPACA
jgi:alpha-beta hydrolase superfamily lysophospholipase